MIKPNILLFVSVSARTFCICFCFLFLLTGLHYFSVSGYVMYVSVKFLSVLNFAKRHRRAAMVPFLLSLFVLYTFTATAQELAEYGS